MDDWETGFTLLTDCEHEELEEVVDSVQGDHWECIDCGEEFEL